MNGKTYPCEFADGRQFFQVLFFTTPRGHFTMEHLSFDQWKQNQVLALQYIDNGKTQRAGLRIYDRPGNVPLDELFDRYKARNSLPKDSPLYDSLERGDNGVERMFIGSLDQEAQIQFRDKKGQVRLKIFVDRDGEPVIDFLDEQGNVVKTLDRNGLK